MSDYEKVMQFLTKRAEDISGEWDGDFPGVEEERAHLANELLELLGEVRKIVGELDI